MKGEGDDPVLAHRDRVPVKARDHRHVPGPFDERRADEDPGEILPVHSVDAQLRLEAVDLPAIAVPPDADVEQSKPFLIGRSVCYLAGEHDHPGAGGKRREAAANRVTQRLEESDPFHQHRHRRAFAAGQDDSVEPFEVWLRPNQAGACPGCFERTDVLFKSTLHREDPDEGAFAPLWATSLGQRAARPSGWPGFRGRAWPCPTRLRLRRASLACRSRWSRRRSPWRASTGPLP